MPEVPTKYFATARVEFQDGEGNVVHVTDAPINSYLRSGDTLDLTFHYKVVDDGLRHDRTETDHLTSALPEADERAE